MKSYVGNKGVGDERGSLGRWGEALISGQRRKKTIIKSIQEL